MEFSELELETLYRALGCFIGALNIQGSYELDIEKSKLINQQLYFSKNLSNKIMSTLINNQNNQQSESNNGDLKN